MVKLLIIGASLVAFHGGGVTRAEAVRAIRADDGLFAGQTVTGCQPTGAGMTCYVQAGTCEEDGFGSSWLVDTTGVEVTRRLRGFAVRIVAPVQVDVYAGACNH